jgi:hypothetical protein
MATGSTVVAGKKWAAFVANCCRGGNVERDRSQILCLISFSPLLPLPRRSNLPTAAERAVGCAAILSQGDLRPPQNLFSSFLIPIASLATHSPW